MSTDQYGSECSKRLDLHVRTLALPEFNYNDAIEYAGRLYGSIGVHFRLRSESCVVMNSTQSSRLAVIDGTCRWDQNNSEQNDLWTLAGIPKGSGIVAFIVGGINTGSGTLNGCAGHDPRKPAFVVSRTASKFTLAHELGHVLLGSSFRPVHTDQMTNIMFGGGTSRIPSSSSPTFNSEQASRILASSFLRDA